jgi:hypothetical protein
MASAYDGERKMIPFPDQEWVRRQADRRPPSGDPDSDPFGEGDSGSSAGASPVPEDPNNWCFMCNYSQDPYQIEQLPDYRNLLQLIDDHYGKMNIEPFCEMVQKAYNRRLRYMIDGPDHGREWTLLSIYMHVTRHLQRPYTTIMKRLRRLGDIMEVLEENEILYERPNGRKGVAERSVRLWEKLCALEIQFLGKLQQYQPTTRNL